MIKFSFKHVCLESYGIELSDDEVSSAAIEDRLAPLYERLKIPFGTLEKLSGIKSRSLYPPEILPSELGTKAAKKALEASGFEGSAIGALFNCSVTRDYFEPATACVIHRSLGLSEQSLALDVSNACIGFSNGITLLGNLIETGIVKAGLLVSGESIGRIIEASVAYLLENKTIGRDELLQLLPTFTLGCGGVAFLLCHESISKKKHRIIGSVARSASELNDLCNGNGDYCISQGRINPLMHTDSQRIISSASKLGGRAWSDFSAAFGWSKEDVKHIFCHQVGRQVNAAFYDEMGLDYEKEFTIYKRYGNLVSAAMPTALAIGIQEKGIKEGEKILLTAFGSGLNCIFTGLVW